MKKKRIITITILMLFLPLISILLAWLLLRYFIFDNPSFWYAYMTYFGTIVLASVALLQNENATLMNERIMRQQLRQKLGYFCLKENGSELRSLNKYQDIQVGQIYNAEGKLDNSLEKMLSVVLRNIGEDLIIINSAQTMINGTVVDTPCSVGIVYKDDTIHFFIDNSKNFGAQNLKIQIIFSLKNVSGIEYQQKIDIDCFNTGKTIQGTYRIERFASVFSFENDFVLLQED